ncbi:MAG: M48 family metalloprotease [Thaumarchaeota archaeon]|nr:M48 family metalloprotease [Nitrososphaerota archaeon]
MILGLLTYAISLSIPFSVTILLAAKSLWLLLQYPRSLKWVQFPEYDKLAQTMAVRLASIKRWGMSSSPGIALSNSLRRQIVFNEKIFYRFSADERSGIVAHELAHLKSRHSLFASTFLVVGMLSALLMAPYGSLELPTGIWFIFFLAMVYYRRHTEYKADLLAARYVDPTSLASALGRMSAGSKLERAFGALSHPPISERIRRLHEFRRPSMDEGTSLRST